MSTYKEESCSLVGMDIDNNTATIKRVLVDDSGTRLKKKKQFLYQS